MTVNFLDFEKPIAELDAKIEELRHIGNDSELNIADEIERLEKKQQQLLKSTFSKLTPWQVVQLARHPQRPHAVEYIDNLFTDFEELHGDRMYGDDAAIIAGLARLDGQPVMLITEEKGRTTKERIKRNFGSPKPEGYRKALRLMKLAERFELPIITLIDTQGAYPGIDAEERGQSEAIARNLFEMSTLKTPIICVVIGEGGSGGALAIGVGDRVLMLEYSVYSVISPEGCASILWRSADKAPEAAESLKMTAQDALKLNLIDGIVKEPCGGAHRDMDDMFSTLKSTLLTHLKQLQAKPIDKIVEQRYQRLMQHGIEYQEKG
jgi:acetyl-CoA carboxylase carboxyl transferase subunit alpha